MKHPLLYEINTRCWLHQLSARRGGPVTLATVPDSEFARWRRLGLTHIWLMGVWITGARTRAAALGSTGLQQEYRERWPEADKVLIGASPYAIGDYRIAPALGGEAGLQTFRRRLNQHGMKLLLDFVPNHVGLDHPWLSERPDLFVQSPVQAPGLFAQKSKAGNRWLAHGRDPYFPPWNDTVQLDYRCPATRAAMQETLLAVAGKCDGVRCDMAMLLLSDVFEKTWAQFPPCESGGADPALAGVDARQGVAARLTVAGDAGNGFVPAREPAPEPADSAARGFPEWEFWPAAIDSVRQAHPDFVFLAEAYWGLEGRLQSLGFDYTYDKVLYDGLVHHDAAGVQRHVLTAAPGSLEAGAHFLENHDEPRIASILSLPEHRAAALLILSLPGMRLLHDGQLEGARVKVPVQFLHRPDEPSQPEIESLYEQLLGALPNTAVGHGNGRVLKPSEAWPGNPTAQNFVLVQWQAAGPGFELVVVNLSCRRSQCYAPLTIVNLGDHEWLMKDLLGSEEHRRSGKDLQDQGLYLDVPGYGAQLFHFLLP